MALKIADVSGGTKAVKMAVAEITFSSSYPAGGEPITASDYGMSQVLFVAAELSYNQRLQPVYDPSNGRLRLISTGSAGGGGTEVNTGTNQSTVSARVLIVGI